MEFRTQLQEIEQEIKEMCGEDPFKTFHGSFRRKERNISFEKLQHLEGLLKRRSDILDNQILLSDEEKRHISIVNNLLREQTAKMYRRTYALYQTVLAAGRDEDFDDDYVVEGRLFSNLDYDPELTISDMIPQLESDQYYGSDFAYMMAVLNYLHHRKKGESFPLAECSIQHQWGNTPNMTPQELSLVDDSLELDPWNLYPMKRKELNDINFCRAFYALTEYWGYSLLDVLHVQELWVETKVVCQNIVIDQNGRRWNP